ncbi:MAG: hypothetical protein AAF479_05955 [Pseudomonadota bacterium]
MERATEGVVSIVVGNETIPIRFTWRAIDQIATKWGDSWQNRLDSLGDQHLPDIVDLLAASTGRPADFWYEASPPVIPTIALLQRALSTAFFGLEGPPAENPRQDPKERSPWWRRIFGSGADGADQRTSSGD